MHEPGSKTATMTTGRGHVPSKSPYHHGSNSSLYNYQRASARHRSQFPTQAPYCAPQASEMEAAVPQQQQHVQQVQQQQQCKKNLQKMMGISPSDIDKYSRIFFPVTFTCFNLMYWIIYLHVSDEVAQDLVMLHG